MDESSYGAARMLKAAGVDRFSLVQRLREMDAERCADLNRAYEAQRAVIMRRVDEARLCDEYLLQRGYPDSLEEHLLRLLPMQKEDLDALAAGPPGPFVNCPELLPEIAWKSPFQTTRTLASIALVRLGRFGERDFAAAVAGLHSDLQAVAVESAMAVAHWRVRLYACPDVKPRPDWWHGFDCSKLLRAARTVPLDSPLGPWAAAALALGLFRERAGAIAGPRDSIPAEEDAAEELRPALQNGLSANDPDLRFTCAMALAEDAVIARELQGADTEKGDVARRFLARTRSPAIRGLLADAPSDAQAEILQNLSPPLPLVLVETVLAAVEKGDAEARDRVVWLLHENLTPAIVGRLVDLALKEKDLRIFTNLLRTKLLPEKPAVVRAILGAGLLPDLSEIFYEEVGALDFSDEAVLRSACENDPNTLDALITIALWHLQRGLGNNDAALHIARFLAQAAFGPHPMKLRIRAYELLTDYRMKPLLDWLDPSVAGQLFGGIAGFVGIVVSLASDSEAQRLCYSVIGETYHRWKELVAVIGEDPVRLKGFLCAIHNCAENEPFPYLAAHTQALVQEAPGHPEEVFPLLFELLTGRGMLDRCNQIPCYVLGAYDELRPALQDHPSLATGLAEALARSLTPGDSIGYPQFIAMDLLDKVLTDFHQCRSPVAEILWPIIRDIDSQQEDDVKERLRSLAEAVGLLGSDSPIADAPSGNTPSEALDHEVLLPGEALATLADYVACMKEIGSASNPLDAMARRNLTLEQYLSCVNAWGDLMSRRDDVAYRYALLSASSSSAI